MRVIGRVILALLSLFPMGPTQAATRRDPLSVAQPTIERALRAAKQGDFPALRVLMVKDFTWSFGGDASVDQAIAAWKEDSRYLRELIRVLGGPCRFLQVHNVVECPGDGTVAFRAGFVEKRGKWRMMYFVEGD